MKIHLVLVRTLHSINVGAAARALANMGGDSLILINPQCMIDIQARRSAAGASEWLENRRTYSSWDDFYANEGEGVRIALTRREGKGRKVYPLREVISTLSTTPSFQEAPHLYLFMGPEDDGLNAEDLALMNYNCELPVHGEFKSLNLSQAALLSLFIVKDHFSTQPLTSATKENAVSPTYFPDESIKRWLTAMGFDVAARKSSAYLTLRRLFLQNNPTRHEVQVLESILQQNIRKLEDSSRN